MLKFDEILLKIKKIIEEQLFKKFTKFRENLLKNT